MKSISLKELLDAQPEKQFKLWTEIYRPRKRYSSRYEAELWVKKITCDPIHAMKRWGDINIEEQALFGLVIAFGGCVTGNRLERLVMDLGLGHEEKGVVMVDKRPVKDLLQSIYNAALLFRYTGNWYTDYYEEVGGMWFIPQCVSGRLAIAGKRAADSWLERVPQLKADTVQSADPETIQRDMVFYWGEAWRSALQVLVSGHIGKRSFQSIYPALGGIEKVASSEKESIYARFLRNLLLGLKLTKETGSHVYAMILPKGHAPEFWRFPSSKRFRRIWRTLPKMKWSFILPTEARSFIGLYYGDRTNERTTFWFAKLLGYLAAYLRRKKQGDVIRLGLMWKLMLDMGNPVECVVPDIHPSKDNPVYNGRAEEIVLETVARVWHWLGAVDLLWQGGSLVGIKITPMGESLFKGKVPSTLRMKKAAPIVQPNFQVLAVGPVPLEDLALLELAADRVKVEHMVVEYRLGRRRFLDSLAAGLDGEYAIRHLESAATAGLPQNVRRSLEEWLDEYNRITVYEGGMLVEADDPNLLKQAISLLSGDPGIVRIGDRWVLIPSSMRGDLNKVLTRLRMVPSVVPDPEAALSGSVEVDADGRIRPRINHPSLYVIGQLRHVADPRPDGTWLLTRESIQRATRSMDVSEILALLKKMCKCVIPVPLERQILVWGNFFGEVKVMQLTLLQFRDGDVLKAARKLPGLSRALRPFPQAPDGGLAVVDERNLPDVLSRLRSHGIRVNTTAK